MNNIYDVQTLKAEEIPFFLDETSYITEKRIEELKKYFQTDYVVPTGSRHIESPPKLGTDDDYLVHLPNSLTSMDTLRGIYTKDGWLNCLSESCPDWEDKYKEENLTMDCWGAFRKGEVNVVVYLDKDTYDYSVYATDLCQRLNVKDKERRIRIFRWYKFREPLTTDDLRLPS